MLSLSFLLLLQASPARSVPVPDPSFHSPPDLQLSHIDALTRAPNGHILLIDGSGEVVYQLDSTGTLLAPLARTGSGPGEVRSAGQLGWHADTLWVTDSRLRRISLFTADLRFIRAVSDRERCGFLPWAIAPDGRCLLLPQRAVPPDQPIPLALPVILARPGQPADTLGIYTLPRMVIRYANGESHLRQPFADSPMPAFSEDGHFFAWVDRKARDPNGPPAALVRLQDLATGRSVQFNVPFIPQPVTEDSVRQFIQAMRKRPFTSADPGFLDSVAHRLYRPPSLPAFAEVLIDRQGRTWFRQQAAKGTPMAQWQVYDREGHPVTTFTLPARFSLLNTAGDRLLGVTLDEDDVPVLSQWRLGDHR